MHYLYRITNILNNKIYIGQTIKPNKRWSTHKSFSRNKNKPQQYVHHAINKYGVDNFTYEVIATCITQEDVDCTEEILIIQYNSRNKEFGYNIQPGGNVSSPSEETREKMSKATLKQIAEQGHPSLGKKRSDEQRAQMRETRLNNPINYTDEIRSNMSEAHIGHKDSEETKIKKSAAQAEAWEKRNALRMLTEDIRCFAPGCDIVGTGNKYKFINGIRYCNKHGLRMLRYNRLDTVKN
jgi:group I intron endonuclease